MSMDTEVLVGRLDQVLDELRARRVEIGCELDEIEEQRAPLLLERKAIDAMLKAATARTVTPKTKPGGKGRPRGTGPRRLQALQLVQERPGITIPEVADAMGMKQNYLYRVLPGLEEDGLVRKEGMGWHPVNGS